LAAARNRCAALDRRTVGADRMAVAPDRDEVSAALLVGTPPRRCPTSINS
jgi:hypothetical protein